MNVKIFPIATSKIRTGLHRMNALLLRRKGLATRVTVATLLLAPLALTGNVISILPNALLLASVGFLVWRFTKARRERGRRR